MEFVMVGVFVIYDNVGECIVTDFFKAKNQKIAMLGFESFVSEAVKKGLSKKAYILYEVGVFDEESLAFVKTEKIQVASGDNVHEMLVALDVLTDDIEEVTNQPDAIISNNEEV